LSIFHFSFVIYNFIYIKCIPHVLFWGPTCPMSNTYIHMSYVLASWTKLIYIWSSQQSRYYVLADLIFSFCCRLDWMDSSSYCSCWFDIPYTWSLKLLSDFTHTLKINKQIFWCNKVISDMLYAWKVCPKGCTLLALKYTCRVFILLDCQLIWVIVKWSIIWVILHISPKVEIHKGLDPSNLK